MTLSGTPGLLIATAIVVAVCIGWLLVDAWLGEAE